MRIILISSLFYLMTPYQLPNIFIVDRCQDNYDSGRVRETTDGAHLKYPGLFSPVLSDGSFEGIIGNFLGYRLLES